MADVTSTFAAKDEGFAAVMQRLQNRLQKFASQMNSISAGSQKIQTSFAGMTQSVVGLAAAYVGVSQAINGFKQALDFSGEMADMATITGESAGNLAVLERAFSNNGMEGGKMLPMLSRMTEFIQQLGNEQEGAVQTAKALGITFQQLQGKTPIEQFRMLSLAIANLNTENERLEKSGDVFGNRMGGKLIPLATNFAEEMAKAREQLGSVVDILDRSAARLDNLGDMLSESIGKKFRDFVLGLLDGAKGADQLVTSLSKIDTAAAGIKLGQLFSGAVEEPHKAFLLMGEVLLLAVKTAGNYLVNAVLYAGKVWQEALTDKKTFGTLMSGLWAGVKMIFNFAAYISSEILKTLVQGVAGLASLIPGIGPALAKEIATPLKAIEDQQKRIDDQAKQYKKEMQSALFGTAEDLVETSKKIPKTTIDFFGEKDQTDQVKALTSNLRQVAKDNAPAQPVKETPSEQAARADNIYRAQIAKIESMDASATEKTKQRIRLDAQYIEALNAARKGLLPPEAPMKDAAASERDRKDMSEKDSGAIRPSSKDQAAASETTLQQAVRFLEELTAKLPSPVLV
jgi:hypothetical protein